MRLHDVNRGIRKNTKRRRLGRGPGSGHGKTAGKGHKGQHSRAGASQLATFQGGSMPLVRRVPKRGFNNQWALKVVTVNIHDLDRLYSQGEQVNPETLKEKSLANGKFDLVKVLGTGKLTKKLKVAAHRFSKTAAEKITNAGGEVIVLPGRTPVEEKKKVKREQAKA